MYNTTFRLICTLLVCLGWVYPFANEPSASAQYQVVACAVLAGVAFFYVKTASHAALVSLATATALVAVWPTGSPGDKWILVAALALAFVGFHVGLGHKGELNKNNQVRDIFLWGTLCGAIINALEGVLQYLGLAGGLWPWVPESLLRGVAYGIFRQPNLFATLLCCGIACVIRLASVSKLSDGMAWVLIVVLHLGVAASGSRIGVVEAIAFAVAGLLWFKQQPRNLTAMLVGQAVVLAVAAVALPLVAQLHGFEPRSLAQRLALMPQDSRVAVWIDSVRLIAERPLLGWGWREFGYGHFMTPMPGRFNPDSILDNAHNMPLQLAVEFGLPLATLLCGLYVWALWRAKPWQAGVKQLQTPWLIILSLTLHSMVEFPLWYAGFLFLGAMTLGTVVSAGLEAPASNAQFVRSPARDAAQRLFALTAWFPRMLTLALLALCWSGWTQYQQVVAIYAIPARLTEQRTAAIEEAKSAWLFEGHVAFAEFGLLDLGNAPADVVEAKTRRLLHFSAEPRIVQALIFALWRQHKLAELQAYSARYCAAFPMAYTRWVRANALMPMMEQVRVHESECKLPKQALSLLTAERPKN